MKNYIRHRLYPQKIAENEEKNKLRNCGTVDNLWMCI